MDTASSNLEELKNLTQQLSSYKTKMELALEIAGVGYWEWDIVTNRLEWDNQMHVIFATNPADFNYDYSFFCNCVHPDDIIHVEQQIKDYIEKDIPYNYTFRVKTGNLWGSVHGKGRILKENGKPVRMIGICMRI
jgi:PAS domain-containing protein